MAAYPKYRFEFGEFTISLYQELPVEPPKPDIQPASHLSVDSDDHQPWGLAPIVSSTATLKLFSQDSEIWDEVVNHDNTFWILILDGSENRHWQGQVISQTMTRDCEVFEIQATDFGHLSNINIWLTETEPFGIATVQTIMQKIVETLEIPGSNTRWYSGELTYTTQFRFAGRWGDGGVNSPDAYTDMYTMLYDVAAAMRAHVFQRDGVYYFVPINETDSAQESLYPYNPYVPTPEDRLKKIIAPVGDWTETLYQTDTDEEDLRKGYTDETYTRQFSVFKPASWSNFYTPIEEWRGINFGERFKITISGTAIVTAGASLADRPIRYYLAFKGSPEGTYPDVYYDLETNTWSNTQSHFGASYMKNNLVETDFNYSLEVLFDDPTLVNDGVLIFGMNSSGIINNPSSDTANFWGTITFNKTSRKEGSMKFRDGAFSDLHYMWDYPNQNFTKIFPPGIGGLNVLEYRALVQLQANWIDADIDGIIELGTHLELFDKVWVVLGISQDYNTCITRISGMWNGQLAATVVISTLQATLFDSEMVASKAGKIQVSTFQQSVFLSEATTSARRLISTDQETIFLIFTSASKRDQVAITTLQIGLFETEASTVILNLIDTSQTTTFEAQTQTTIGGAVLVATSQITTFETEATGNKQIFFNTSQQSDFDTYLAWIRPEYLLDWVSSKGGFSLTKLKDSALAPIQVYRSSDGASLDIGFDVDGWINESELQSFCGGSEGFVQALYDQQGIGNNAFQFDPSKMPKIYDGANVLRDPEGNVAMLFDGIDDYLETSDASVATGTKWRVIYAVGTLDAMIASAGSSSAGSYNIWAESPFGGKLLQQGVSNLQYSLSLGTSLTTVDFGGDNVPVSEMIDHVMYKNNEIDAPSGGSNTSDVISTDITTYSIGRYKWNDSDYAEGYLSELIIFAE